jgi:hypothetical protein
MRWKVEVFRYSIHGKSRRGNWYEGRFRWRWAAYIAARVMAVLCDCVTPTWIMVDGEWQEYPLGIRWEIREA